MFGSFTHNGIGWSLSSHAATFVSQQVQEVLYKTLLAKFYQVLGGSMCFGVVLEGFGCSMEILLVLGDSGWFWLT